MEWSESVYMRERVKLTTFEIIIGKGKLLTTRNFFFSCFGLQLLIHQKKSLWGNGLFVTVNPFPHIDAFWRICSRRLLKILRQWEISQFATVSVFNSIQSLYFHLKELSKFLPSLFQSFLLLIYCMLERVKNWTDVHVAYPLIPMHCLIWPLLLC